jgi:hypothetical protein
LERWVGADALSAFEIAEESFAMKFILLAATALIAAPVLAQTTPAPAETQTAPAGTPDQSTTPPPADASTAPTDAAAATAGQAGTPAPMTTGSGDPVGGYAPTGSAVSGGTPGTAPTFRAAPTPAEAYPAPAPLAKYPVCKKGQFDKCMQRGGK